MKGKIALLSLKGPITSEGGGWFPFFFGISRGVSVEKVIEYLERIAQDKKIKALVLEISSPGGTPFPCQELVKIIKNYPKPVVAWVREYATSGAYWIASVCKKIVADQLSLLGSIGVASIRPDFSGLMKRFGVEVETISSGIYKTLGMPYLKFSQEERKVMEEEMKVVYELFIEEIRQQRKITPEQEKEISTGKVFFGKKAQELNLIDLLGGKKEAFQEAQKLANLTEYEVVDFRKKMERRKGFLQRFF